MATASVERDAALEELFRTPPATFTRTRDALARKLKDEGDPAAAAEVKKLRRPPVVAYVLNQLARSHADDVAELVDVGRELARAQRKALRGETSTGLREAIARQRDVVSALTSKTARLMKSLDVPAKAHLDEIAGALQAALVDPAVGERLEEGRLEEVPAPAAGFGHVQGAETQTETRTRTRTQTQTPTRTRTRKPTRTPEPTGPTPAQLRAEERAAKRAAAEAKKLALESAKRERKAARAAEADDLETQAREAAAEAKRLDGEAKRLASEAKKLAADAKKAHAVARTAAKRASALRRR